MDILLFGALFAAVGFIGGLLAGRRLCKHDRMARWRGVTEQQAGRLADVLKVV